MDSYKPFVSLEIIRESVKLLYRNIKITPFTTTVPLIFLYSTIFFCNFYIDLVKNDILFRVIFIFSVSPTGSEIINALAITNDIINIIQGVEVIQFLAYWCVSYTTSVTIVIAAALSFSSQNNISSYKDLFILVSKSWKRSFVVWFHVLISEIGCALFVFSILLIPILNSQHNPAGLQALSILLAIFAFIYFLHLSVVWVLAIVISVIEESCHGTEALGKAGALVKGKRLHGFILNSLFVVFSVIFFRVFRVIGINRMGITGVIAGFFGTTFLGMVKMLQYMAYTLLYFQCKENEEDGELQGMIMESSKTPSIPPLQESLPI